MSWNLQETCINIYNDDEEYECFNILLLSKHIVCQCLLLKDPLMTKNFLTVVVEMSILLVDTEMKILAADVVMDILAVVL